MQEVGKVTHYYDKAGAAIVALSAPLSVGDSVKIQHKNAEFEQAVASLQVDRKPVTAAKAGEQVGLKVEQPVAEGAVVYRL